MDKKLVTYSNNMNTVAFGKFKEKELDIFFSICYKVKDLGTRKISLTFSELRKLSNYSNRNIDRFIKDLSTTYDKILGLNIKIMHSEKSFTKFNLFNEYTVSAEDKTVTVQINEKFEYILNIVMKDGNFTKFELMEFVNLKSSYSKNMFKLLKQWESTRERVFDIEEFRDLLAIPPKYKMSVIDSRVLKPIMEELPNHFYDLKMEKLKTGRTVTSLKFTWRKSNRKVKDEILEEVIEEVKPIKKEKAKPKEKKQGNTILNKAIEKARKNIHINRFNLDMTHIEELLKKYSEEEIVKGLNYAYENIRYSFKRLSYIEKTINSYLEAAGIEKTVKKARAPKVTKEKKEVKKKQEEKGTDKLSVAKEDIKNKEESIIDRFNNLEEDIKNYVEFQALEECVKTQKVAVDFLEKMKTNSPAIYYNTLKPYIEKLITV